MTISFMQERNIFFKLILIWFLSISIVSTTLLSDELSNLCSRDKNVNEFTVLSYHEISDKSETLDSTYAVTPSHFEEQVHWLIDNGYQFISINDILKYRKYKKSLPSKAVLMTFDDGYQSVYTNAYPLIKKYKIPVVIALVGSWMEAKEIVDFDGHKIPRNKFLSHKEIREMARSGLVEYASHSYSSHKGIQGNPQGNMQPAMITREWLNDAQMYEDEKRYQQRIYNDLLKNNRFIQEYTGQKPRVMVWPYGYYNKETRTIAERLGMSIGLTLDDGSNTHLTPLWGLRRILIDKTMSLKDLEQNIRSRNANLLDNDRVTKAAHIDLDYMYDADPAQQERNLGDLLDRIKKLGVNTVYLQAFADPDANGAADYVYFPNRNLPMRADLFNRVAWQIATRTQVKRIYAWMPMMAWQLPHSNPASNDTVVTLQVDSGHLNMGYPRLSPFAPQSRKVIKEIYEDLAKSPRIDGILFHDDVTLSDFEDDSKAARTQYKKWGLTPNVTKIRVDREQYEKWTNLKTDYLDAFAMQLAQIIRDEHPGLKTARNLYAQVALNKYAEEWYAQGLSKSINRYDYTAIMAMPYMEQASDTREFYDKIVERVKQEECGLERTVMELQTVNWRKNDESISSEELNDTITYLYGLGIHHMAYYPDSVFKNIPNADTIKKAFGQKAVYIHMNLPNNIIPTVQE
ncbi:poly-beta-1,6-N-acetyl-D-glucosamine N-deacetylase PgaB [Sulfuricurvum sp.]|uniref:poly-beta-1,6-N-acetyl-D-glucosamine N-deacetylase PgaB n=1 Tax=Sulfuricurvum sp. TaxID=2025608 RepID=UPI003BB50699